MIVFGPDEVFALDRKTGWARGRNMATRLHRTRRTNRSEAERAELAEWLTNFKPKTELGLKLLTLSKIGLANGESLLDADQIMKELGRRRYDK